MTANGHGGNLRQLAAAAGLPAAQLLDFSANLNPLGPPEWLRPAISSTVSSLVNYPDPENTALVAAVAARYGARADEVLAGNGSTELLYLLPPALEAGRAVIPVPCYSDYARAARLAGCPIVSVPLREADGFVLDLSVVGARLRRKPRQRHTLVFIGQPNNPTGRLCCTESLRDLAREHPETTFVVDEAFADFVDGYESLTVRRPGNVVVLLSLTKIFAIPGLRLGCAVASRDVVRRVQALQPPWSVNAIAQAVGVRALHDAGYLAGTRAFVREQRQSLQRALQALPGLTVYPSDANFLLARLDHKGLDAPALARRLLREGVAIRVCDNFEGLDGRFFRVAVRNAAENERLCEALRRVLAAGVSPLPRGERVAPQRRVTGRPSPIAKSQEPGAKSQRARTIMFQGTSSNAGKSVLCAALCRILLQDGYRVAPFKSQNMSLNSFVTRDGGEMGRAQAVQAQACRIEPDVRMNPILLKPNSDTGSQVIVCGKPLANMDVARYIRYKPEAFAAARRAFDKLASEYDVVVLEGAGSPGEVNLKAHDIVNMHMARYAAAPVLLVGDIDRGGVFASFVGTMEVLAEWERALVAGFVVNRFRGKEALLADALEYTLQHAGRPVLGVVPYIRQLGLPEEDSVSFKDGAFDASGSDGATVEVAVVDLPHISNFTDFDALRLEPDVRVRIVRAPEELRAPDAVILPGSKNVIGDLEHLRRTGLERKVLELAAAGATEVVGICGGLQMLGKKIEDPHRLESARAALSALGLLPLSTTLAREKTLTRVTATHLPSGLPVTGYEIHHGRSTAGRAQPLVRREDGEIIGSGSADGLVWGTYLHGIFDADEFRRWFVDRLRVRKRLPPLGKVCARYDLEPAFERLADIVRRSLRMDRVYRLMGLRR
ncbi:MAG: cobyric acid synthase [Planctomycetota bacterium]|nr:cobyric acid synthase [Planctomycetota bacterium]